MGIGDWGLVIGDWGLGLISNAQGPNHQPQSPIFFKTKKYNLIKRNNNY